MDHDVLDCNIPDCRCILVEYMIEVISERTDCGVKSDRSLAVRKKVPQEL